MALKKVWVLPFSSTVWANDLKVLAFSPLEISIEDSELLSTRWDGLSILFRHSRAFIARGLLFRSLYKSKGQAAQGYLLVVSWPVVIYDRSW